MIFAVLYNSSIMSLKRERGGHDKDCHDIVIIPWVYLSILLWCVSSVCQNMASFMPTPLREG